MEPIGQLASLECATLAKTLEFIADSEESQRFREDGAATIEIWLQVALGWARARAVDRARMARALRELPCIAQALFEGQLSEDQVSGLTRFATPETDAELAIEARGWSPANIIAKARYAKPPTSHDLDEAQRPSLRIRQDGKGRRWTAWFPDADSAVAEAKMRKLLERERCQPGGAPLDAYETRSANALLELIGASGACRPSSDVMVFTDTETLLCGTGWATLRDGTLIPAATVQRLFCSGRSRIATRDEHGLFGISSTAEAVPKWALDIVWERDQGRCVFEGCPNTRWLDAHHVIHREHGGTHEPSNLCLLCLRHHKLVHEGGWTIKRIDERWQFFRPDGTPFQHGPPGLDAEIHERFFGSSAITITERL